MQHDKNFILLCENIGKYIQKIRKEKGLTIADISKKTGICPQYLRKIEKGTAYGVLVDKHLFKIAEALGVKLSELFVFEYNNSII